MTNYHDKMEIVYTQRLRRICKELPEFCQNFFIGIEQKTLASTRLKYAYNLDIFFKYIQRVYYPDILVTDLPIKVLDEITSFTIEKFLSDIKCYKDDNYHTQTNGSAGIYSKLSAIRSLYNYFFMHNMIKTDITRLIPIPKKTVKNIIHLSDNETKEILKNIKTGVYLSEREKKYNEINRERDYAIFMLLIGTGIRVSECTGININDINFIDCSISIVRKGGNQDLVYMSDEVCNAVKKYYDIRKNIITSEPALFLSRSNTRLGIQSIQKLVKKYSKDIRPVTPHKLRSTYGTNLYAATGDIYLVATNLGHSNINNTQKYYAAITEERKKDSRNILKISE